MPRTILYFPTIKIKDGIWLRNALMYWDNIASIVPENNYEEENSIEVEYLKSEGIYKPIYPRSLLENESICNDFCNEIKRRMNYHVRMQNGHDRTYVHSDKLLSGIHMEKMPFRIVEFLEEVGVLERNSDGPWLTGDTYALNLYMSVLAKYLAMVNNDVSIGTDDIKSFDIPIGINNWNSLSNERNRNFLNNASRQLYLQNVMKNVLPIPNMDVPFDDIIRFRRRRSDELKTFRERIDNFEQSMKCCYDKTDLNDITSRFQEEIVEDLGIVTRLLDENKISFSFKSMKSIAAIGIKSIPEIAALYGKISSVEAIGINAAIEVSQKIFFSGRRKLNDEIPDSITYLFYAERENLVRLKRF